MPMAAPALKRILDRYALGDAFTALTERMSGADVTTWLLEVMRRRAARVRPSDFVGRAARDRFTSAAPLAFAALRRCEDAALRAAPAFEPLVLSPLAPFGLHSSIATVDQNKIVTTIRGNEVAADPTNALALEAALRRRALLADAPKSDAVIKLAAVQRVVRAQQVSGPRSFAHFSLAGFVSAGRDVGSRAFEADALVEHLRIHAACALDLGATHVRLTLSDFTGAEFSAAIAAARVALAAIGRLEIVLDPERASGRGYYRGLCFKSYARFGADEFEIGDGGIVDWTAHFVGSAKERCFISGIGLDRLALAG
jgi:hypothetical protein